MPVAAKANAPKRLTIAISVKPIATRLKLLNIMGMARVITSAEIRLSDLINDINYRVLKGGILL
jgi:hypothetical protein